MRGNSNREKCTAMEEAYMIGVAISKDNGKITCGTDKENSSMKKVIRLRGSGRVMFRMDNCR